jgi:rhodanese-related sulfurtransferase
MDRTVSTKELQAKLQSKDKIKLVETLAADRYQQGHIPGALNIPPEKVKELAPQVLPNKEAEIITYCSNTH